MEFNVTLNPAKPFHHDLGSEHPTDGGRECNRLNEVRYHKRDLSQIMTGALNRKTRCESEPCTRPLAVELGAKSERDAVSGIARNAETSSQHTK